MTKKLRKWLKKRKEPKIHQPTTVYKRKLLTTLEEKKALNNGSHHHALLKIKN